MRTVLTYHERTSCTEAASLGPSKMPQPPTQAYSVPERLTPSNLTAFPRPSTRVFPDTLIAPPSAAAMLAPAGRKQVNTAKHMAIATRTPRVSAPPPGRPCAQPGHSPEPVLYRWIRISERVPTISFIHGFLASYGPA